MLTITTYEELKAFVVAASRHEIGLTVITGPGGTGKSYTIKKALKESGRRWLWLSSHATPASTYEQLYHHTDETVFINDIDGYLSNRTMLGILKQLCETENVKTVQYNSKTPLMADLPRSFETTSPVIIDANTLPKKSKDLAAFFTRGVHVEFEPTVGEVMSQLTTFAKDEEVLKHLSLLAKAAGSVDLRKYLVAVQLKEAKLDWKKYLREELSLSPDVAAAIDIGLRGSYAERSATFTLRTGKSARTYDRILRRLKRGHRGESAKKNTGSTTTME